ncbi:MAG TPA: hypothetical protein VEH84_15520 [Alphaproteobacteria bacterium]|nr:hypothetical protein [Alphaproteobacteria bacterium]
MFLRAKKVAGRLYYQVVETYRDGGRVRHRSIVSLGTAPSLEAAAARLRADLGPDPAAAEGEAAGGPRALRRRARLQAKLALIERLRAAHGADGEGAGKSPRRPRAARPAPSPA